MSESESIARLHPADLIHVTMAVTVDTSDLSEPQKLWVAQKATEAERAFAEYVEDYDQATVGQPQERDWETAQDDSHGPSLTVHVGGCTTEEVEQINKAAQWIEQSFTEKLRDARYWS